MSKWKEWKNSLGEARPWHLLSLEKYVSDESVAKNRLKVCEGCKFYTITNQCLKCGCLMSAKVMLSNAECPIGKWGKEEGK